MPLLCGCSVLGSARLRKFGRLLLDSLSNIRDLIELDSETYSSSLWHHNESCPGQSVIEDGKDILTHQQPMKTCIKMREMVMKEHLIEIREVVGNRLI